MEKIDDAPVLSTNFESSIPGLYVVGLASAASFGPLCRFAFGAQFTSGRISSHLADTAQRSLSVRRKPRTQTSSPSSICPNLCVRATYSNVAGGVVSLSFFFIPESSPAFAVSTP